MIWQDFIVAMANVLFSYGLIIQVIHGFKTKRGVMTYQTATFTSIGLFSIAISFISLNLFLSGAVCTFNATMWSLLLIQKIKY